ncbi:MAG TPA: hypothetical protein VHY18_00625 [Solirubrobacteraceae bacterium]|jgi:hypothetical protein|nr:hypothetical protein [Solirubrobacteraceae bacterium]
MPLMPAMSPSGIGELTAYSTLAVAVFTLLLVAAATTAAVFAKKAIDTELKTSSEELQAIREAALLAQAATERQLEASRRPLLIDVAPYGPVYTDMGAIQRQRNDGSLTSPVVRIRFPAAPQADAADPRRIYVRQTDSRLYVMVPLRNAGNGLAILDSDEIQAVGAAIGQPMDCEIQRERVPAGETTRILCTHEIAVDEQRANIDFYELAVPYRDFAGGQLTVALVRLERMQGGDWQLRDVQQTKLENLSLPSSN